MTFAAVLAASSSSSTKSSGSSSDILILLVLVGLGLFLFQRRGRSRQAAKTKPSFEPGAEVMTRGGMFGTVVRVEDNVVVLEVADGVELRFLPGAIGQVVDPGTGPSVQPLEEHEDEEAEPEEESDQQTSPGVDLTKNPRPHEEE